MAAKKKAVPKAKAKAAPRKRAAKKVVNVDAVNADIDKNADKVFAGNNTGGEQLELDEVGKLKAQLAEAEAALKGLTKEPAVRKNFHIPAEMARSLKAFSDSTKEPNKRSMAEIVVAGIQLEMDRCKWKYSED